MLAPVCVHQFPLIIEQKTAAEHDKQRFPWLARLKSYSGPSMDMTCCLNLNHCETLGYFMRHLQTSFVDGLQPGFDRIVSISSRHVKLGSLAFFSKFCI